MSRRPALAALALVLGTAGCADVGSDGSATDTDLVAASQQSTGSFVRVGDCFAGARFGDEAAADLARERGYSHAAAGQRADDPVWTDGVDCQDTHKIEAYGVVGLPHDLDAAVGSYADLLDTETPLYRAVRDNVVEQCASQDPLIAAVAADTKLDLDILPMIGSDTVGRRAWDPVPPDAWEAGQRTFVCTFQQPSATTTRYRDILTGRFPDAGRSCLAGDRFVACDEPHDTERVAVFIVDRSIDRGLLDGEAAVTAEGMVDLGTAEWTMLDDACQRYINAIAPNAPTGIYGVADTYPELFPNEYGAFNILCLARSPFGTDPDAMVISHSSIYEG